MKSTNSSDRIVNRAMPVALLLSIITLGAFSVYTGVKIPKTAFIDTVKVYNSFELKQELERELSQVKNARQNILDSMVLELKILSNAIEQGEGSQDESKRKFNLLRENYITKKQDFEEVNESLAKQYTEQVWSHLNQYIKDYGEDNHYKYIYGANGQGNLMYAEEADDISGQVIKYVNERFNGSKK